MPKIFLIGDKPSAKNWKQDVPFIGAGCFDRLQEWLTIIEAEPLLVINQSQYAFIRILEIANILNVPVVALGNNASKALKDIPHFKLPHPSGLNRQINDKNYINQRLLACKSYIFNEKTLARARSLNATFPKA